MISSALTEQSLKFNQNAVDTVKKHMDLPYLWKRMYLISAFRRDSSQEENERRCAGLYRFFTENDDTLADRIEIEAVYGGGEPAVEEWLVVTRYSLVTEGGFWAAFRANIDQGGSTLIHAACRKFNIGGYIVPTFDGAVCHYRDMRRPWPMKYFTEIKVKSFDGLLFDRASAL
ncbi:hypothetical protein IJT93_07335 [bacterium]|nr:hypothetical protein [bacterium]